MSTGHGWSRRWRILLLVPMLNEGRVIASTLQSLLQLRGNYVVRLIDDASDDDTLDTVHPYLADTRVHLLARHAPDARTGKGEALNASFAEIARLGLVDRYGPTV